MSLRAFGYIVLTGYTIAVVFEMVAMFFFIDFTLDFIEKPCPPKSDPSAPRKVGAAPPFGMLRHRRRCPALFNRNPDYSFVYCHHDNTNGTANSPAPSQASSSALYKNIDYGTKDFKQNTKFMDGLFFSTNFPMFINVQRKPGHFWCQMNLCSHNAGDDDMFAQACSMKYDNADKSNANKTTYSDTHDRNGTNVQHLLFTENVNKQNSTHANNILPGDHHLPDHNGQADVTQKTLNKARSKAKTESPTRHQQKRDLTRVDLVFHVGDLNLNMACTRPSFDGNGKRSHGMKTDTKEFPHAGNEDSDSRQTSQQMNRDAWWLPVVGRIVEGLGMTDFDVTASMCDVTGKVLGQVALGEKTTEGNLPGQWRILDNVYGDGLYYDDSHDDDDDDSDGDDDDDRRLYEKTGRIPDPRDSSGCNAVEYFYSKLALYVQTMCLVASGFSWHAVYWNTLRRQFNCSYLLTSGILAATFGVLCSTCWAAATGRASLHFWCFWPFTVCQMYMLGTNFAVLFFHCHRPLQESNSDQGGDGQRRSIRLPAASEDTGSRRQDQSSRRSSLMASMRGNVETVPRSLFSGDAEGGTFDETTPLLVADGAGATCSIQAPDMAPVDVHVVDMASDDVIAPDGNGTGLPQGAVGNDPDVFHDTVGPMMAHQGSNSDAEVADNGYESTQEKTDAGRKENGNGNGNEEPRNVNEEPRNGNEEPRNVNEEPRNDNEEPRNVNEEPRNGNEEPRNVNEEPRNVNEEP